MKPAILEQVTRRLAEMGVSTAAQLEALFAELRRAFSAELEQVTTEAAWKEVRDRWQGRKAGVLTLANDNWLKSAAKELKPTLGRLLNELRAQVASRLEERRAELERAREEERATELIDISLPGTRTALGAKHPITQVLKEIEEIFVRIGFSVAEGPEIETPYYNFEALNIPEHHPARDVFDTLYINDRLLLRTHTSPVQIRTMEKHPPPVRIIVPGKVYRHDNPDSTHSFMFNQVEGLAVDSDITFCEFKGTLDYFIKAFFGPQVRTRFRPSYFPFTEPSAEVDMSCVFCRDGRTDEGRCPVCKGSGWIEALGAGMVNPAVYGFVNARNSAGDLNLYDPAKYSGFAFGLGVERFAMFKYGINDIQLFFQNDLRFLQQFRR